MARTITKLELQQQLNTRSTECVALRAQLAEANGTIAALREQLAELDGRLRDSQRAGEAMSSAINELPLSTYKQTAARARELAKKTGKPVVIGGRS